MNRSFARRAAAIASVALLAACVVNLSFEMKKTYALKSPPGAPSSVSQAQQINLADYKEITDHKSSIKSLDLDYADVTVVTVAPDNAATSVSGSLVLRLDPADTTHDVKVGDLTNVPVVQGSTVRLNGSPALDAFLFQQLQTQGTFYAVVTGSVAGGPADVVVSVDLHASLGYDAGL